MAPVTLPPSFFNSFWSPDYRTGLEVLFKQLDQGCTENNDIVAFIESQAKGHQALADTLSTPPLSHTNTTSSLQHSLLSLRGASAARGQVHQDLAEELGSKVSGFKQWKDKHESRVGIGKEELLSRSGIIAIWEKDVQRLMTLRQTHWVKSRAADDSEDDAKFAPSTMTPSSSTSTSAPSDPSLKETSPTTYTSGVNSVLRRSGTVADRINAKLRDANVSSNRITSIDGKELPPPPSEFASPGSPTREEPFIPPSDPNGKPMINGGSGTAGKGSSERDKEPDIPQPPILLSGLALPFQALHDLFNRFSAYLLTNPAPLSDTSQYPKSNAARLSRQRTNLLGTHEKTFNGEEMVQWLRDNVEGFGGDYDRSLDAAEELYRMGHVVRIGVGRGFDPGYDTYYTLKTKAQSGNVLTSALSPTTNANIQSMMKHLIPGALAGDDEPQHVKLRREATKADEAYREGVAVVEERRLEMEERIERGLRTWERWERERLAIVKSVLKQYGEAIARHAPRISALTDSTALSVEAFNPDADLKALIEGNRTGPFRPQPHTYDSIDVPDVNFGIDLRKWSGELGWKGMMNAPQRPKGSIPEVLEILLRCLGETYESLPDDERRKSWIYEVPLVETHALRSRINSAHASREEIEASIKQFNVPVIAGTIKLYLLELNPPVMGWEGWEDAKAVYPQIGADQERDVTSALTSVLTRLPGIHLYVLNAIVKHFVDLIANTKSDEPTDNYITKLSLSVGRCILRPQYETELTFGDRTPSLFLADLIKNYTILLPPLVDKKKKDSERIMPVRKRTALVDQRMSRSSMGGTSGPSLSLGLGGAVMEEPSEEGPSPPMTAKPAPIVTRDYSSSQATTPSKIGTQARPPAPVEMPSPPDSPTTEEPFVPPSHPTYQDQQEPPSVPAPDDKEVLSSPSEAAFVTESPGGASGLKRATSGEASSRLRGPRGARGPRPAPGRVVSGAQVAGITPVAGSHSAGNSADGHSDVEAALSGTAASGAATGNGAATVGGLKRGTRVHKTGGSVSQAIADLEGRSR